MIDVKEIGKQIRRRRRELGMTQMEAAEKACTTHCTVSNVERGARNTSIDIYLSILKALDLEIELQSPSGSWINATVQAPKQMGTDIVCCGQVVMLAYWMMGRWTDQTGFDITDKVTHWMPLPEPPEGG